MRGAFMRSPLVLQRPASIWLVSFFAQISGLSTWNRGPCRLSTTPSKVKAHAGFICPLSGDVADIDTVTCKEAAVAEMAPWERRSSRENLIDHSPQIWDSVLGNHTPAGQVDRNNCAEMLVPL
jgi:hypothetical protein